MRARLAAAVAVAALTAIPLALAKIGPAGVRVCGADRCARLADHATLRALNTFVYGPIRVTEAPAPREGARVFAFELGGVFSERFETFRSHGIICGRFRRGHWYHVPEAIAHELRRVSKGLTPHHLGPRIPPSC